MKYEDVAKDILDIAIKAGDIILDIYNSDFDIGIKDNATPVTNADIAANDYIVEKLKKLTPKIPIVSEESFDNKSAKTLENRIFWLVDPLDGTKGFIKKNGEFTVNIALIENKKPIGGVVYIPVTNIAYYTGKDGKAYKLDENGIETQIQVQEASEEEGYIVIASQSHNTPETDEYIKSLPKVQKIISTSSSIKFCLVAEGIAHIYPRFGRTMEWDTGAGHAVLQAAGGKMEDENGEEFLYCKKDFANGHFIASSIE